MRRILMACGGLILAVGVASAITALSREAPRNDDSGATQQVKRNEVESQQAQHPEHRSSDTRIAKENKSQSIQTKPVSSVPAIVRIVTEMAEGGRAARTQARDLAKVLLGFKLEVPKALAAVASEEPRKEAMQPTAAEILEVAKLSGRIVNLCKTLQHECATGADVPERLCAELLTTLAVTSPSRHARMLAASLLVESAAPSGEAVAKPGCQVAPAVASRSIAQAIEFALGGQEGDLGTDLASALLQWQVGRVLQGYLTLSVLAHPDTKEQPVDALVLPIIKRAEELSKLPMPAESQAALKAVLEDLRKHQGITGNKYTATLDRQADIQAFFGRLAEAINAEDKQAFTELMPPTMADKIAAVKSLRESWGGGPNTAKVVISVVGPVTQVQENVWRVAVNVSTENARQRDGRVVEFLLARDKQGYRIRESK